MISCMLTFSLTHHFTFMYDGTVTHLFRYMTILYYLNDIEEGGETAFPMADNATLDIPVSRFLVQINQLLASLLGLDSSYPTKCDIALQ